MAGATGRREVAGTSRSARRRRARRLRGASRAARRSGCAARGWPGSNAASPAARLCAARRDV